jgi:hypothetical protein
MRDRHVRQHEPQRSHGTNDEEGPRSVRNRGDDYGFTKTVVPVDLTRYGDDNLVSRSQARRLLARVDRFKTVVLDSKGVDAIGQAFVDEVFRVFPGMHPEVKVVEINARSAVKRMIGRARSAAQGSTPGPAPEGDDDQMSLL